MKSSVITEDQEFRRVACGGEEDLAVTLVHGEQETIRNVAAAEYIREFRDDGVPTVYEASALVACFYDSDGNPREVDHMDKHYVGSR